MQPAGSFIVLLHTFRLPSATGTPGAPRPLQVSARSQADPVGTGDPPPRSPLWHPLLLSLQLWAPAPAVFLHLREI